MSSIATVQVRQRGSIDFPAYYESLCALQDTCPLREVLSGARQGRIDVNADRVRLSDWYPLLKALQINKSLIHVAFRRYRRREPSQEEQQSWSRCRFGSRVRFPAIGRRDMTLKLSKAIADCLSVTTSLESLQLEDISLQSADVSVLAKGIGRNRSLKNFSVKYCQIGDNNVDVLCRSLKNSKTIVSVDFSGCCLTGKGGKTVADLIQHQATERHSEAWKESLRHRHPNLNSMSGLKRVTLCSNPLLGDKGAVAVSERLKDDLWLKAIDLQQCGITNVGARALQNVMQYNTNLVVIDIRLNQLVDPGLRDAILDEVTANAATDTTQDMFPWLLLVNSTVTITKQKTKATVVMSAKKGALSSRSHLSTKRQGISSQTTAKIKSPQMRHAVKAQKRLPWRTTTRFIKDRQKNEQRYKGAHETSSVLSSLSSTSSESGSQTGDPVSSVLHRQDARGVVSIQQDLHRLQVEVESCRRILNEESDARARAEAKVVELEVENKQLKAEIYSKHSRESQKMAVGGVAADEHLLGTIEASFKQFHSFMDLLRDNDLGHLCALVGHSN